MRTPIVKLKGSSVMQGRNFRARPYSRDEAAVEIDNYLALNSRVAMAAIQFTGEHLLDFIGNRVAMVAMRQAARELIVGILPFPSEAGAWDVGVNELFVAWKHMDGGLDAEEIRRYLKRVLSKDLNVSGVRIEFEASIGVAIFPMESGNAEQLIGLSEWRRMSSVSCYGGAAQVSIGVKREASQKMEMEINAGLVDGAFNFSFKPQVDMLTGALAGFASVMTWNRKASVARSCQPFELSAAGVGDEFVERFWRVVFSDFCVEARNLSNRFNVAISLTLGANDLGAARVVELLGETMGANGLTGDQISLAINTSHSRMDKEGIMSIASRARAANIGVAIAGSGENRFGIGLLVDIKPDLMIMSEPFGRRSPELPWMQCIEFYIRLSEGIGSAIVIDGIDSQLALDACLAAGSPAGSGRIWFDYEPAKSYLLPEFLGKFNVEPTKLT